MTSNLMATEKGGEQTQYEGEHTDVQPHKKSGGQLGNPETAVDFNPEAEEHKIAQKGGKNAENIRFGQGISESGMGGMTTGQTESGSKKDDANEAADQRKTQGYGDEGDMRHDVGA